MAWNDDAYAFSTQTRPSPPPPYPHVITQIRQTSSVLTLKPIYDKIAML